MKQFTNRKEYISKLLSYKDKDLIKVISGLRRSGKSTLLELFRKQLLDLNIDSNQIHEYNFELPENYLNKTWSDLYFEIKEKLQKDKQNYIFLDEIQNIPSFERLVDGLFATENTDVYVTGSNAYLLSSELATLLSGRYVEISILPFSFQEYLTARNIDYSNKYLNFETLFFDYVNETSLPKGAEIREEGLDKIYEYLVAIELKMLMWDDAWEELSKHKKIPHRADYGIDLISPDFTKTAQVKYYGENSTVTWRDVSTYISYSLMILGISDMQIVTTSVANIPSIVDQNIPITRFDFDDIFKPKRSGLDMLISVLKKL